MSEAPKEAPVRKYLPSSVYLEEKTDEQKKEEVNRRLFAAVIQFIFFYVLKSTYTGKNIWKKKNIHDM